MHHGEKRAVVHRFNNARDRREHREPEEHTRRKKARGNKNDARERARKCHHAQQALTAAPYKQNGDADKRERAIYALDERGRIAVAMEMVVRHKWEERVDARVHSHNRHDDAAQNEQAPIGTQRRKTCLQACDRMARLVGIVVEIGDLRKRESQARNGAADSIQEQDHLEAHHGI